MSPIRGIKVGQGASPCSGRHDDRVRVPGQRRQLRDRQRLVLPQGVRLEPARRRRPVQDLCGSLRSPRAPRCSSSTPRRPTRVTTVKFYSPATSLQHGRGTTSSPSFGFTTTNPAGEVEDDVHRRRRADRARRPPQHRQRGRDEPPDWDGTDPPLPRSPGRPLGHRHGRVRRSLVTPGPTGATIHGPDDVPDCHAWVAQVVSIAAVHGTPDADGDQLLDGWEANGYDDDNNGTIDVDLPAGRLGPQGPLRRDGLHGRRGRLPVPPSAGRQPRRIMAVFASAPVNNPTD